MILVDCSELSADEKLALASQISDSLEGVAVALVKGEDIVLDQLTDEKVEPSMVKNAVESFIWHRDDAGHFSVEVAGDRVIVHSADPASAMSKKEHYRLPPNLKQCPYCSFISEYDEEMTVHVRTHLFGV
jgi:hypothetical protein